MDFDTIDTNMLAKAQEVKGLVYGEGDSLMDRGLVDRIYDWLDEGDASWDARSAESLADEWTS